MNHKLLFLLIKIKKNKKNHQIDEYSLIIY